MDITIFLAKVLGWFLLIMSFLILSRFQLIKGILEEGLKQPPLFFFIAVVTLIMGLALVVMHNVWLIGWPVVITIYAWLILMSALIRLFLPERAINAARVCLQNPIYVKVIALINLIVSLVLLVNAYSMTWAIL